MARHERHDERGMGGPSAERLLRAMPGVVLVLDTEGRPTRWNDRAADMLGLSAGEPRRLAEAVRPAHRQRLREALATVGESGTTTATLGLLPGDGGGDDAGGSSPNPYAFEFSTIVEDGERAGVLAVGREAQGEGPDGNTGSTATRGSTDTTTAVGAERSDDPFADAGAVERFGDGAYAVDADRRVTAVDEGLLSTLGHDRETLVGARLRELLTGESQAAAVGFHEALLSGDREEGTVEVELRTAAGDHVPAELHAAATDHDDGSRTVVGVVRDVSDRQRREHQLAHHRDQLATLNRISEAVEEVVQGVVDSATREGIERAVCERLADSDLYRTVWIGRSGPGEAAEPAVTVGSAADFHPEPNADEDSAGEDLGGAAYERSASVALRTGEPCVRGAEWLSEAPPAVQRSVAEHGIRAVMALPITHNDTTYGVLCLYSPRSSAFSDREQDALERLARVVGFAIHAADTEHLLRSGAATELEFRITAADSFLAALSRDAGHCELRWTVPDEDDTLRHYIEVDATGEAVLEAAAALPVETVAVVSERPGGDEETSGCVVEARVRDSVAARLAEAGAVVHNATATEGIAEFTARIAGQTDTRTVVEALLETHEATLVAKRRVEEPVRTVRDLRKAADDRLTERQTAVLRTAYLMGYFEWPREHTAEEVAERMDITSATLHYHLRSAERGFLELFFEDASSGG
jgi:PAS domain S-box-containing protein